MAAHRSLSTTNAHASDPTSSRHSNLYTSGRGGAGNILSFQHTSSSQATRTTSNATSSRSQRFPLSTGRGGVGNFHSSTEYAIFSFDEELEQQLKLERDVAPVFHIGRGGAGNSALPDAYAYDQSRRKSRFGSSGSSSSTTSDASSTGKIKEWPTTASTTTTTTTDSWRSALKRLSS